MKGRDPSAREPARTRPGSPSGAQRVLHVSHASRLLFHAFVKREAARNRLRHSRTPSCRVCTRGAPVGGWLPSRHRPLSDHLWRGPSVHGGCTLQPGHGLCPPVLSRRLFLSKGSLPSPEDKSPPSCIPGASGGTAHSRCSMLNRSVRSAGELPGPREGMLARARCSVPREGLAGGALSTEKPALPPLPQGMHEARGPGAPASCGHARGRLIGPLLRIDSCPQIHVSESLVPQNGAVPVGSGCPDELHRLGGLNHAH